MPLSRNHISVCDSLVIVIIVLLKQFIYFLVYFQWCKQYELSYVQKNLISPLLRYENFTTHSMTRQTYLFEDENKINVNCTYCLATSVQGFIKFMKNQAVVM